jgi:hypothetical protein
VGCCTDVFLPASRAWREWPERFSNSFMGMCGRVYDLQIVMLVKNEFVDACAISE